MCVPLAARKFLWDISAFYAVCPLRTKLWFGAEGYQPPPTKHTTSRWSASVSFSFRELRARNDGAVLLDSHALRVVAELIQQTQYGALCGHCSVFSVNFHANILFSARKNAPGFTMR